VSRASRRRCGALLRVLRSGLVSGHDQAPARVHASKAATFGRVTTTEGGCECMPGIAVMAGIGGIARFDPPKFSVRANEAGNQHGHCQLIRL